MTNPPKLGYHPGYIGAFSTNQAEGAIPNGEPFVKVWSEEGDAHPTGATGRVLGSLYYPEVSDIIFYFVEFDDTPGVAIGTTSMKVGRVDG